VLASGEQGTGLGPGAAVGDRTQESRSLEVFLGDLQTLWQSSQPRRRKPRTRTGKRTRPDPFEADVALIEGWLQAEPLLGSRELMERLVDTIRSATATVRGVPCSVVCGATGRSGLSWRWQ